MHGGLLNMKGEKMAKSLGNVIRLDAAIDEFGGEVLRFYYLNAVYRNPLEYEEGKSLPEAREAYERLVQPYRRIAEAIGRGDADRDGEEPSPELLREASELPERLDSILAEDFNSREAVAALFVYARHLGEWIDRLPRLSGRALQQLSAPYLWASEVLGIGENVASIPPAGELGPVVEIVLAARARARERGDYAEADRLRDELRRAGIVVEDAGGATRWRPGGRPGA